jgi:CDGSH-type Zn-finger protein
MNLSGPGYSRPVTEISDTPVTITPYEDGPLLVRGEFEIRSAEGEVIDPGRSVVALCRCGLSALKPFCDGTHKVRGFRAPGGDRR